MCNIKDGKCFDRFEVSEIGYNSDREITRLQIVRVDRGKRVPVYDMCVATEYISEKEQTVLRTLCEKRGYDVLKVFPTWPNLTGAQYAEAVRRLQG
ncbi:MAG: hypothetical protein J6S50_05645 [Oscillospiraceae bacterium]|nr:hypothetical protein [Oscillospiraceae bacterium]